MILKPVGIVFGVLALVTVVAVTTFGIRWVTAGPKGKLAAREQIQSGSNRIAQYEHFFNLCASVQGLEASLVAQNRQLKNTEGSDRDRIMSNIAGIEAERGRAIAQYNVDARKSYTSGQFRSSDLPYQLDFEGSTTCVA